MSADVVRSHLRNGEITLARQAALGALATAPDEERGELYALLSRALYRLGQPREAMKAAEEAAARTDHWEASLAHGEALVAVGEPHAARARVDEALHRIRGMAGAVDLVCDEVAEERFRASRPTAGDAAPRAAEAEVRLGLALAEACRAAGDPQTGVGVATRALVEAERQFGAESPEAAEARHVLGVCLHGAGREKEARKALETALLLRRRVVPDTAEVAATLDALAIVERALGQPWKAVERHEDALSIWIRTVGEHSGPLGACRHAYAQALHRTGDFHGARDQMARALLIATRTLGGDHVDTWITRFELGRLEVDCGDVMEGLERMRQARGEVASRLGRDHPVVRAMDRWL